MSNLLQTLDRQLPVLDLGKHQVKEFDYGYNQNDDFLSVVHTLLQYNVIIVATPVYWYGVSAKMKIFIDRLSDLLSNYKALGRQLKGKTLAVVASYATYPGGTDGFERPLINTARYLGMTYMGTYFHYSGEDLEGKALSDGALMSFSNALGDIMGKTT